MVSFLLEASWWDWPLNKISANEKFFSLDLSEAKISEVANSMVDE